MVISIHCLAAPGSGMSAREDETSEQHFNERTGLGNLSVSLGGFFFSDGEVGPLSVEFC
jgi:hypothetical protein